jgi:hypothetical protein
MAAAVALIVIVFSTPAVAKKKSKPPEELTRQQLQSLLMSYSDRYIATLEDFHLEFLDTAPPYKIRAQVSGDIINAYFDVINLAASPNPEIALLDLVVLVTLQRMIYEDHWRKIFGKRIDSVLSGFKNLEKDIWQIAGKVLTREQQNELRSLILKWRNEHPDIEVVNWLRFADFATERYQADFIKKAKSGSLLPALDKAARQVEETRLLAERAMFLATRYPLLSGVYSDFWLSSWLRNPEVSDVVSDLHSFTESTKHFGNLVQKLPEVMRQERTEAIDQMMDRVAKERKEVIRQLANEEKRLGGLIVELRQTIIAADALVQSSDALAHRLGVEPDTPSSFDINDYRLTIEEATVAIRELGALFEKLDQTSSVATWDKFFPIWQRYFDDIENSGTNLIDYALIRVIWVVIISFTAYGVVKYFLIIVSKKHSTSNN